MDIGNRIRQRRKELGLTLPLIHKLTGISAGNLSEYENNNKKPSALALIKLSEALDCSIDWMLLGNTTPAADAPPLLEEYIKLFQLLDQKNQEEIIEIIKLKLSMGKGKK